FQVLNSPDLAYISRYSLGRDYHKLLRQRLKKLAQFIENEAGALGYRVFVDSAPVLEKAIAEKAGLGWIGKHSNLLSRDAGSWFFLGEIYVDIPLQTDGKAIAHCGQCTACMAACPTQAIVAPYQVDARRCISYLTIENKAEIPVEFRKAIGNRIYGCDDCQLVCPWNRFSQQTEESDFSVRHNLDSSALLDLFAWDEDTFLSKTEGSAIRRIGYQAWLRNIAVALGNTEKNGVILKALHGKLDAANDMVKAHIVWAIEQHVCA
ncbi:MAG TPA: tRNA epoxyqueuosine(34) reductase QueG, partial [Gammaproteobacteria bacterium]|nr:tRNA epoxyqueuosine(34) reductase QueG [Gammaproteobacteria bacterium]